MENKKIEIELFAKCQEAVELLLNSNGLNAKIVLRNNEVKCILQSEDEETEGDIELTSMESFTLEEVRSTKEHVVAEMAGCALINLQSL